MAAITVRVTLVDLFTESKPGLVYASATAKRIQFLLMDSNPSQAGVKWQQAGSIASPATFDFVNVKPFGSLPAFDAFSIRKKPLRDQGHWIRAGKFTRVRGP